MFLRTFSDGAKDKRVLVVGREIFPFFYGFREFNFDYLKNPDDLLNHMEAFRANTFKLAIISIILEDTCKLDGISFGLLFKSIYKDSEVIFVSTYSQDYVKSYYQKRIASGGIKDFVLKKFHSNFYGCPQITEKNIQLLPEIIKANFRIVDINKNMKDVKLQINDILKENEELKFAKNDETVLENYLKTYLADVKMSALQHQNLLEEIIKKGYIKDKKILKRLVESTEIVLQNIEKSIRVCNMENMEYELKDCIKNAFDIASVEIPYSFDFNIDEDVAKYTIAKVPIGHMKIIIADIMKNIFKTCRSEDMTLSNLLDTRSCKIGSEKGGKIILIFSTGIRKKVVFSLDDITKHLMEKYGITLRNSYNKKTDEQVFNIKIPF